MPRPTMTTGPLSPGKMAAIGTGATVVGSAMVGFALASNPVGWGIAAVGAVGSVLTGGGIALGLASADYSDGHLELHVGGGGITVQKSP
jgi:hypothetical protein